MQYLIAPTAYKGTLSPIEAAQAIAEAVSPHPPASSPARGGGEADSPLPRRQRAAGSEGFYDLCPIADGGTGWLEVWEYHFPAARRIQTQAHDALNRLHITEWLLLPNGVAVLESAQAIGIHRLRPDELAPMEATSRGVAEMLLSAAQHPAVRELWLGLGGVATTDGGAGALSALGFKLLDAQGNPIPEGGRGVLNLHTIQPPVGNPLQGKPLTLCADVQNTLLDAARVYAPQKGATPSQVETLAQGLEQLATVALRDRRIDLRTVLGAGAAGGLAGGLHAYLHAPIVSGIAWLLKHIGWDTRLAQADCLITGEGQVDAQTLMGKGVGVLIQQAVALGKPVIVLTGRKGAGWEAIAKLPGVHVVACAEIAPDLPPAEALGRAAAIAVH